jgi:hypothetical protein
MSRRLGGIQSASPAPFQYGSGKQLDLIRKHNHDQERNLRASKRHGSEAVQPTRITLRIAAPSEQPEEQQRPEEEDPPQQQPEEEDPPQQQPEEEDPPQQQPEDPPQQPEEEPQQQQQQQPNRLALRVRSPPRIRARQPLKRINNRADPRPPRRSRKDPNPQPHPNPGPQMTSLRTGHGVGVAGPAGAAFVDVDVLPRPILGAGDELSDVEKRRVLMTRINLNDAAFPASDNDRALARHLTYMGWPADYLEPLRAWVIQNEGDAAHAWVANADELWPDDLTSIWGVMTQNQLAGRPFCPPRRHRQVRDRPQGPCCHARSTRC